MPVATTDREVGVKGTVLTSPAAFDSTCAGMFLRNHQTSHVTAGGQRALEVFRLFRYENGGFLLGILVLQNAAKQLCGIEDTEFDAVFASSVRAILASSSFVSFQ